MPGDFSKSNRPVLPGPYFHFEGVQQAVVQPNLGQTVCVVFTNDWGPFKTPTLLRSFAEFEQRFGKTAGTAGRIAVHGAFKGEGVPGRGGAGAVLAYRMGGSAAAKATRTIQSAEGTPAAALVLTAKHEGTRGNLLRALVIDTPGLTGSNDLIIQDGTLEVERYTHADTDMNGLLAAINANSQWVTASGAVNGKTLWATGFTSNSSPVSFTGGDDGATVTASDYTAVMSAIEPERFSVLAFANISPNNDATDTGIMAALQTWAKSLNANGKRFMTVVGGAMGEALAAAQARAAAVGDENFVTLGIGTYTDAVFGDLSTSRLAPRVAGIVAQRGEVDSLTYARLADLTIKVGPTEAEKLAGFKSGITTIGRDSNALSPVRLEKGVTAYTATNDPAKPYVIYRNPKFLRTMHGIQMEFTEWTEASIIGQVVVNDKVRDAVRAELGSRLQRRVDANVIQPNPTVLVDQDPPPSDDDEFLAFVIGLKFGRSAEQVFLTIRNA